MDRAPERPTAIRSFSPLSKFLTRQGDSEARETRRYAKSPRVMCVLPGDKSNGYFILRLRLWKNRDLFVAQGGHGIEAAGAEGGDVAGGASDEGESGGGKAQRKRIVRRQAEELALDDSG